MTCHKQNQLYNSKKVGYDDITVNIQKWYDIHFGWRETMKITSGSRYHFKRKEKATAQEYLEAAIGAERYIRQFAIRNENGLCWKKKGATWSAVPEEEIDLSFYSGNTGILFYYLKLYEVTKKEEYLEIIHASVAYIVANWRKFFEQTPIFGSEFMNNGLYMGVGGIGLVLLEVYKSTKDELAKQGAVEIFEYYVELAKEAEDGIYWSDSPAVAMDGGVILFYLEIRKQFGFEKADEQLRKAAPHYLAHGIEKNGTLEYRGWAGPGTRPNYEFGTAGAGYILTLLYEYTGEEQYLEAAKKADRFMRSIKVDQRKGYLHPYDTEMVPPIYFLSSCHGVGGNSKLYLKLYEITGDEDYLNQIDQMIDGIESVGAPEQTSDGFWNTLCFCCGHSGMVHYFLGLYQTLGKKRYLDLARRTASILLGEAVSTEDGATHWPMAFWRVKPEFLTIDLGFYDGIAGIGTALLESYLQESEQFEWNRLIDDPFHKRIGE